MHVVNYNLTSNKKKLLRVLYCARHNLVSCATNQGIDVYDFMVEKAMEYQLGAPGLRSICESVLIDAEYELPSSKVKTFTLTKEYAERKFQVSKLSLLNVA